MLLRQILVPALFISTVYGCGPVDHGQQELAAIPAIQGEVPILGMGFSSLDASVTGNTCFTGLPIQYQTARDASLNFYRNLDYENLSRLLDAKLEIGVPVFPGISVQGRVRFADEFASSDYAETMTLHFKAIGASSRVYFGETAVENPVPTPNLQRLIDKNDQVSRQRLCGDQFVSAVDKGIELFATLKMEFTDSYARTAYGGGFGAEILGGIASVQVDLNYEKIMKESGAKIVLAVEQRGGDPLQLLSILPSATELKSAGIQDEPTISFLSCTYESRQMCYEVFRRLSALAQTMSDQVKADTSETVLGNMVPIAFETRDYPDFNSMRLASLGTEDASVLRARREKLEEGRRKLLLVDHDAAEYRRRTEVLLMALDGRGALTTGQPDTLTRNKLLDIQSKSEQALQLVEKVRRDCYNPETIRTDAGLAICQQGTEDLWKRFYEGNLRVRETDLNLDPQSFTEWCVLAYTPHLLNPKIRDQMPEFISSDDFAVVKLLLEKYAKIPDSYDRLGLDCKFYQTQVVSKLQDAGGVLNLDGKKLGSIKPLRSLTGLTQLSLVNNSLEDVIDLRDLPNLKQLNLRRNKIRSLSQLRGFASSQLEHLDISRNVIGNGQLEDVLGQSDFKWPSLDVNGNVITEIRALSRANPLKRLDLRGNPVSDLSPMSGWTTAPGFTLQICQNRTPVCPLASGTCQIAPATDALCLRTD